MNLLNIFKGFNKNTNNIRENNLIHSLTTLLSQYTIEEIVDNINKLSPNHGIINLSLYYSIDDIADIIYQNTSHKCLNKNIAVKEFLLYINNYIDNRCEKYHLTRFLINCAINYENT